MKTFFKIFVALLLISGGSFLFYKFSSRALPGVTVVQKTVAPEDGLVFYMNMDNESINGITIYDKTALGYNATTGGAITGVSGKIGEALTFDGIDDTIDIFSTVASVPLTMCAWFNIASTTTYYPLIWFGNQGSTQDWHILGTNAERLVYAQTRNSGPTGTATSTTAYTDGVWHHACAVFASQTDRRVFLDGENKGTNATMLGPTGLDRLSIGKYGDLSPEKHLNGSIDEVRVYDRALSDAEISQLYNATGRVTIVPTDDDACSNIISPTVGNSAVGGSNANGGSDSSVALSYNHTGGSLLVFAKTQQTSTGSETATFNGKDLSLLERPTALWSGIGYSTLFFFGELSAANATITVDYGYSTARRGIMAFSIDNTSGYRATTASSTPSNVEIPAGGSFYIPVDSKPTDLVLGGISWRNSAASISSYGSGQSNELQDDSPTRMDASSKSGGSGNTTLEMISASGGTGAVAGVGVSMRGVGCKTVISNSQTNVVPNGLVGYWSFDGPDMDWASATAEVLDQSGQGNRGNAESFGQRSAKRGIVGQGINFDGADDTVSIPFDSSLNLPDAGGSIVAWARTDEVVGQNGRWSIFWKQEHTNLANTDGVNLEFHQAGPSDPMTLRINIGNGTQQSLKDSNTEIEQGTWYHVATTWTSSDVYLYINGARATTTPRTDALTWPTDAPARIGQFSASHFSEGIIDEVRVYNRTLTDAEILELYQGK